jgi:hypothetical protein
MLSGSSREEKIIFILMLIETRSSSSYADTLVTELSRLLAVGGDRIIQIFVSKNLPNLFKNY